MSAVRPAVCPYSIFGISAYATFELFVPVGQETRYFSSAITWYCEQILWFGSDQITKNRRFGLRSTGTRPRCSDFFSDFCGFSHVYTLSQWNKKVQTGPYKEQCTLLCPPLPYCVCLPQLVSGSCRLWATSHEWQVIGSDSERQVVGSDSERQEVIEILIPNGGGWLR